MDSINRDDNMLITNHPHRITALYPNGNLAMTIEEKHAASLISSGIARASGPNQIIFRKRNNKTK